MYAQLGTHSLLSFAVNQLCRHMGNPSIAHQDAATQTICYLKHTMTDGSTYSYNGPDDSNSRRAAVTLVAYSDSDWAGDLTDSTQNLPVALLSV